MFYSPSVSYKIWPILEIGPGSLPYRFSDLWLDYYFEGKSIIEQSGGVAPAYGKPKVYYRGGQFPFKDKTFRYVIASHVLEHVKLDEIPLFISEMERVADAGYIEVPRWTWEMIGDFQVHLSYCDVDGDKLIIYKKNGKFETSKLFSEMLKDLSFQKYISESKELFFVKYEWEKKVKYEIKTDVDFDYSFEQIVERFKRDIKLYSDCNIPKKKNMRLVRLLIISIYLKIKAITRKKITDSDVEHLLKFPVIKNDIDKNIQYYKKCGNSYYPND